MKIKAKQQGVVLIVSLILILVLTLAVSSNMSGILVDEKIVANQKEHFLASEAAEAALREAENKITQQQVEPSNALTDGTSILPVGAAKLANDKREWCLERDDDWWDANGTTANFDGAINAPKYVIEDLAYVQDSLVTGQQLDKAGRKFYRITAKGGTRTAKVILQTTFTKRY